MHNLLDWKDEKVKITIEELEEEQIYAAWMEIVSIMTDPRMVDPRCALWQRKNQPVYVDVNFEKSKHGELRILDSSYSQMITAMSTCIELEYPVWDKTAKDYVKKVRPITEAMYHMFCARLSSLGVPTLHFIVNRPVYDPTEGRVLQQTLPWSRGIIHVAAPYPIPPVRQPPEPELRAAFALMADFLQTFQVAVPEANRLPFLASAIALYVIRACGMHFATKPIGLATAKHARSGKSTLQESYCYIASGVEMEKRDVSKDPIEFEKSLTAAHISGAMDMFFDNVRSEVASGRLEMLATTSLTQEAAFRLLGVSKDVRVFGGRNYDLNYNTPEATFSAALLERSILVNLTTLDENPGQADHLVKNFMEETARRRGEILWALWTIFYGAQFGDYGRVTMVGFEDCEKVLGVVQHFIGASPRQFALEATADAKVQEDPYGECVELIYELGEKYLGECGSRWLKAGEVWADSTLVPQEFMDKYGKPSRARFDQWVRTKLTTGVEQGFTIRRQKVPGVNNFFYNVRRFEHEPITEPNVEAVKARAKKRRAEAEAAAKVAGGVLPGGVLPGAPEGREPF